MFQIAGLARRARRQGQLYDSDCENLPRFSASAEDIIAHTSRVWDDIDRKAKGPQLWRVAISSVRKPFMIAASLILVRGICNAFVLPMLTKYIIEAVVDDDITLAASLLAALVCERICGAFCEYFGFKVAMTTVPTTFIQAIGGLVVQKAAAPGLMGIENAGVDPSAYVGRELSVLHGKSSHMLPNGLLALPTLIAGCVALFVLLGWSAAFGVVWVLFTIRVGVRIQDYAKKAEERMSIIATERLDMLTNVINAMKAIKYFAWEPQFMSLLLNARARECLRLEVRARWTALAVATGKLTPVTGSLVTFVAFALLGNELKASDIFAANTVFMTLRFSVGALSFLTELYKSTLLTLARAEKLLSLQERPPRNILPPDAACLVEVTDLSVSFASATKDGKNEDSKDDANRMLLNSDLGFRLSLSNTLAAGHRGKLTAICGPVGSGKSVFLSAILGHVDGDASMAGIARSVSDVGWCPQKPFIISGSVRENILLGRPLDEQRLARCLADACLGRDLELLRDGLDEVVGERGTTLSGGQQARLGLARALYGDPSLLLLDDPLAAVDAAVGRALLRALRLRCTRGDDKQLPGAIVVLNQLPLLPNFDNIVFVKDGVVAAHGSFEAVSGHPGFQQFLEGIDTQLFSLSDIADLQVAEEEAKRVEPFLKQTDRFAMTATGLQRTSTTNSLIQKEGTASGFVRWAVWRSFLFAPGRCFLFFLLFVYVLAYATLAARDLWMTVWADQNGGSDFYYVGMFIAFSMSHVFVVLGAVIVVGSFALHAGRNLHSDCLHHLMLAPMSYFDKTPSGRITSRLGPDLAMVDTTMAMMIDVVLTFAFMAIMISVTVAAKLPIMAIIFVLALVLSIPVVTGLALVRQDTKRHSNNAMAPVLSNLGEIRRGAALAATLGCTEFFMQRHRYLIDQWGVLSNVSLFTTPVAQFWCHFMHMHVLAITGLLTFWQANELRGSPGLIAMYFSYATLWGLFAMVTMGAALMALTNGASLERLVEFKLGDVPQEAPWRCSTDPAATSWPLAGGIRFEQVSLRYRQGLPLALDCFDLTVAGGEKLGIVGRTGAGKSSITNVLFRLVDCEAGAVTIDGVNIASLGLHTLRKAISMIPQEPIVMSGTVRYNLDPFDEHTDAELTDALEKSGLRPGVDLDTVASSGTGGSAGLSAGQKQLVTLGRTLLQQTRLVMMDEPTASVDMQTDRLVQGVAREAFASRTVLIIAHRLDTVRHCDRIAVMDSGKLVELGTPDNLFNDSQSRLAQLASAAEGPNASQAEIMSEGVAQTVGGADKAETVSI